MAYKGGYTSDSYNLRRIRQLLEESMGQATPGDVYQVEHADYEIYAKSSTQQPGYYHICMPEDPAGIDSGLRVSIVSFGPMCVIWLHGSTELPLGTIYNSDPKYMNQNISRFTHIITNNRIPQLSNYQGEPCIYIGYNLSVHYDIDGTELQDQSATIQFNVDEIGISIRTPSIAKPSSPSTHRKFAVTMPLILGVHDQL
jgi:hypothetical protein